MQKTTEHSDMISPFNFGVVSTSKKRPSSELHVESNTMSLNTCQQKIIRQKHVDGSVTEHETKQSMTLTVFQEFRDTIQTVEDSVATEDLVKLKADLQNWKKFSKSKMTPMKMFILQEPNLVEGVNHELQVLREIIGNGEVCRTAPEKYSFFQTVKTKILENITDTPYLGILVPILNALLLVLRFHRAPETPQTQTRSQEVWVPVVTFNKGCLSYCNNRYKVHSQIFPKPESTHDLADIFWDYYRANPNNPTVKFASVWEKSIQFVDNLFFNKAKSSSVLFSFVASDQLTQRVLREQDFSDLTLLSLSVPPDAKHPLLEILGLACLPAWPASTQWLQCTVTDQTTVFDLVLPKEIAAKLWPVQVIKIQRTDLSKMATKKYLEPSHVEEDNFRFYGGTYPKHMLNRFPKIKTILQKQKQVNLENKQRSKYMENLIKQEQKKLASNTTLTEKKWLEKMNMFSEGLPKLAQM